MLIKPDYSLRPRFWVHTDLVVSANIQQHWETLLWSNTSTGCVECQLPDGNPHPVAAQVTESQDTLTICHHNGLRGARHTHQQQNTLTSQKRRRVRVEGGTDLYVFFGPRVEHGRDVASIVDGDEEPSVHMQISQQSLVTTHCTELSVLHRSEHEKWLFNHYTKCLNIPDSQPIPTGPPMWLLPALPGGGYEGVKLSIIIKIPQQQTPSHLKSTVQLQISSPWSPEGKSILLTCQADGGSIDDGHELLNV